MSQFDDMLQKGQDAAAAAKDRVQASYDSARDAAATTMAKGREQARKAGEKVAPAVARGKAGAAKAGSRLKQVAEEQPLTLIAGAVALGALIGSVLPKGRRDDDA